MLSFEVSWDARGLAPESRQMLACLSWLRKMSEQDLDREVKYLRDQLHYRRGYLYPWQRAAARALKVVLVHRRRRAA